MPRRRFSKPLLAAGSALLALAVAWPTVNWIKRFAKPKRQFDYGLQLVDDADRPLGTVHGRLKLVLDPFTVYRLAPNQETRVFTINAHGGRGPEPKSSGPTVAVLGGSAAFGQELASDAECFAARLQAEHPQLAVWNFAAPGYFSGQELAYFTHRLRDRAVDVTIAFDGWNDLFDVIQGPPRRPDLYGVSGQFFEIRDRLAALHAGGTQPSVPPPTIGAEERFQRMCDCYLGNVLDLHRLATARGGRFLWILQPELGSRQAHSERERQTLAAWEKRYGYSAAELTKKYAELRRRATAFAVTHGIELVDVNSTPTWRKSTEELFADPVHPNAAGHRVIAECLGPAVVRLAKRRSVGPSAN